MMGYAKPSRLWLKPALLALAGLLAGLVLMATAAVAYKNSLQTRAITIAESLNGHRATTLKEAPTDAAARDDYLYLKDKLVRIKAANADARTVYLMAREDVGGVYFLADSEPEGSADSVPRGKAYPEASDQLKGLFNDGLAVVEGPTRDDAGKRLSALAPVYDDESHQLTAVVGLDVPVAVYGLLLGLAGGGPLLLGLLAAAIVYVRSQIRRRHHEAAQFRAEMLSIASHELRAPLAGLRWGQEDLLGRKPAGAGQRRILEAMHDSTLQLEESIEDLLQLAGQEPGRPQRLFKKETDLRLVVENVILLQRLAAERHNVKLSLAASWPKSLKIECDAQRLKRVFHNVISNAVKYSRKDTSVTIGYGRSNEGAHVITVQDHGIGIPADEQSRVWGGYYRASNATGGGITGTGTGLFLSQAIIRQHGGRMWLESEDGKGTTVFIELPAELLAD